VITPATRGVAFAWPHPGVTAVELWDVVVGGATLFARRDEPSFYASLATAVRSLRDGAAVRATGEALSAMAWDSVALVGGAVDESRARDAFDAAGVALDVVSDDPFFAASHGREALAEEHASYADAIVLDVGQTAVKAWGPAGRVRRPRSTAVVSDAALSWPSTDPARAALVDELAGVVVDACQGQAPSFLLLGVPCEVLASGGAITLGASTYPLAGDAVTLLRAVLDRAGHGAIASAVVNDAVLAAWAIGRRSPTRARARLVLTVGLGVGAALLAPAPAAP
jgi:hypothetical protein